MKPDLLYLVHRIPYPPNKGDKVRSCNILKHLARNYRIHLGTFIDHPDDWQHIAAVKKLCASVNVLPLPGWQGKLRCIVGLVTGKPLSIAYYRDATMQRWVDATVATHGIERCVVFSAAMQQFVDGKGLEPILDLVDVDSEKWRRYAQDHRFPLSWVYRREARTLLAYESASALQSQATLLSTPAETQLLVERAAECRHKLISMENGVDTEFFNPDQERPSPYPDRRPVLIFTGAMDYWPNIDAVGWFVREIFPEIQKHHADTAFYIVGSNPHLQVKQLHNGTTVFVTGTVPGIQPYIQHAALSVAPIRIARGIQNKVLEAMAMGKAVVVTEKCAGALGNPAVLPIAVAASAQDFAAIVVRLLEQPQQAQQLGQEARRFVQKQYNWPTQLAILDTLLTSKPEPSFTTNRINSTAGRLA